MKSILRGLGAAAVSIALALGIVFGSVLPGDARSWTKNPQSLASDYLSINDDRGNGERVIIFWIAPPMFPLDQQTPAVKDWLDKYVIIGAVHAHFSALATATFDPVSKVDVFDQNGQPLTPIERAAMPLSMRALETLMESALSRAAGPMGQGIHWYAFEAGTVRACAKGGMAVQFAGVKYTYDTPVPGCP